MSVRTGASRDRRALFTKIVVSPGAVAVVPLAASRWTDRLIDQQTPFV